MAAQGGRVVFGPQFDQEFICATCGKPDTPPNLPWANGKSGEAGVVVLLNRGTDQCLDSPRSAVNAAGKDVKKPAPALPAGVTGR
jgi:hypothetical protein